MREPVTVTIAICTWNRAGLLSQTLDHLRQLRAPADVEWSVLVVNNASTDDTQARLQSFTPPYSFRWVTEPTPGLSAARNRALAECSDDFILFTDDDVLVAEEWLATFIDAASRHPNGAAFGGPIAPWFPIEPDALLAASFPALRRGFCAVDLQSAEGPVPEGKDLVGANMGYRCDAITGLRFREDLGPNQATTIGGDEMDFQAQVRARGRSVIWVPAMRVKHYVEPSRMTRAYLLKFAEDGGRREIRLRGEPAGATFAGVPRWLVRKALAAEAEALWSAVCGRPVDSLVALRRRQEFLGMIRECRERSLQRRRGFNIPPTALQWK
jgi:glycosyltransferase involved in cell wall biosynthesis